jgi:hypothetical protein
LRGIKIDAKFRAKGFMFFAKLAMKLEEILLQIINMCPPINGAYFVIRKF